MKTCEYGVYNPTIDEVEPCGNLCEGSTDMCASHNAFFRKLEKQNLKAQEKRTTLIAKQRENRTKVKDLKDGNLWVPFSKYIRLRDSDEYGQCTCFTCGLQMEWNSGMQAGHFIGRRHWATRYNEKNVHAQCPNCNMFQSGMQYEYGLRLDKKYGEGTAKELYELSNQVVKFTQEEIDELAAHYRELVKEQFKRIYGNEISFNKPFHAKAGPSINQERETI